VDIKVNPILALARLAVNALNANIRPRRLLGEIIDMLLHKFRVCIKTLVEIIHCLVV
jgi:hypothetical protein